VKTIALVIGHSNESQGARNKSAATEFEYNERLVSMIYTSLYKTNVHLDIVYRGSYKKLPDKVNKLKPDYIISFHCNAYNKTVSGTETLYYHSSKKGKLLAEYLQSNMIDALGLKDRGIKPKHSEDRGGYLLRYTKAPCVIIEPFFIDNDEDFLLASLNMDKLAFAISDVIKEL